MSMGECQTDGCWRDATERIEERNRLACEPCKNIYEWGFIAGKQAMEEEGDE